jgi:hypothetical protein
MKVGSFKDLIYPSAGVYVSKIDSFFAWIKIFNNVIFYKDQVMDHVKFIRYGYRGVADWK